MLVLILTLPGLQGPRPGAPLADRTLGIDEFWLIRIVETTTPSGASWVMETNWQNLLLALAIGGVVMAWRLPSGFQISKSPGEERRRQRNSLGLQLMTITASSWRPFMECTGKNAQ